MPASVDKKHFVRFFISDMPNYKILDDPRGWNSELFRGWDIESAYIDGNRWGDIAIIEHMDYRFVLKFLCIFAIKSPPIVKQYLMLYRYLKSGLNGSGNMFELCIAIDVYE